MSAWLSLAVTIVLVAIAYLILNRHINRRTSQQAALDDIKREVGAIITELNATTERNIELIEDRIATLEKLIQQADKRVGVLKRDLASRAGESTTYSRLGLARQVPVTRPVPENRARAGIPEHRTDATESPPAAAQSPPTPAQSDNDDGATEAGASNEESFVMQGGAIRQERGEDGHGYDAVSVRERVLALYLRGLSLERIASIVGKTVGEVELIISLDEGVER